MVHAVICQVESSVTLPSLRIIYIMSNGELILVQVKMVKYYSQAAANDEIYSPLSTLKSPRFSRADKE
jgi:hypothetical protein